MTAKELRMFKTVLEEKLDDALRQAQQRRHSIAIEQSPDPLEQISYAADREMAIAELSRRSGLVRQLRAALARLEDGTFGVCLCCDRAIPHKRLKAVPWTPFCIQCQETADAGEAQIYGTNAA